MGTKPEKLHSLGTIKEKNLGKTEAQNTASADSTSWGLGLNQWHICISSYMHEGLIPQEAHVMLE